jgi:hypothetical protein
MEVLAEHLLVCNTEILIAATKSFIDDALWRVNIGVFFHHKRFLFREHVWHQLLSLEIVTFLLDQCLVL